VESGGYLPIMVNSRKDILDFKITEVLYGLEIFELSPFNMHKREFVKISTMALGASLFPMSLWSRGISKSVVRTAHIGVGNMGLEDLKAIASHAQVEVVALCDVDQNYLAAVQKLFPNAKVLVIIDCSLKKCIEKLMQ